VKIAENIFKVRGQRSMSYLYKCVNAITADEYISRLTVTGLKFLSQAYI